MTELSPVRRKAPAYALFAALPTAATGGAARFRHESLHNLAKPRAQCWARALQCKRFMKPIVLTHSFQDGTFTESEPTIMTWNGVEMPKVLRTVKPGQYVLLPYDPTDDILRPSRRAA